MVIRFTLKYRQQNQEIGDICLRKVGNFIQEGHK